MAGSVDQPERFESGWFERHPVQVAFSLVGAVLVVDRDSTRVSARIVETEAYGGAEDDASHATMYKAGREALQSDPGGLYMQRSYGIHTMTNIVAHDRGCLGAVLLRAADDPVEGLELVRGRRAPRQTRLLVGPGCLSQGMGTRMSDMLTPLGAGSRIWIAPGTPVMEIRASSRIGIGQATEAHWRFLDANSACVSKHRRGDIVHLHDLAALIAQLPVLQPGSGSIPTT